MKDIYIPKDLKVSGINDYIMKSLNADENIKGKFSAINILANNLTLTNNASIGIKIVEDTKFSPFANIYRIVITDKRLLFIGLNRLNDDVNGIREIEYDEIVELKIKKDVKLKIKLNENIIFSLNIYNTGEDPVTTQDVKDSLEYLSEKLGERFVRENKMIY